MPVRISKTWRPAVRAIARLQNDNVYPEWGFFWSSYTRTQQKAVREVQREMLSKKKRPVQELTPAQVAFHGGLTDAGEAFSLQNAMGGTTRYKKESKE